jgi:hypothetical protein
MGSARSSPRGPRPVVRRAARARVCVLHLLGRRLPRPRRALSPRRPHGHGRSDDERRSHDRDRLLAQGRVPRRPRRHRAQIPRRGRTRAPARGTPRGGTARRALLRNRRSPLLLPEAARAGMGARRRRRLPQGPDHRRGDHRRIPRRRAARRRARRGPHRPAPARGRARRLRKFAQRGVAASLRADVRVRFARTAVTRAAGAVRGAARRPRRDESLLRDDRGQVPVGDFFSPENIGRIVEAPVPA